MQNKKLIFVFRVPGQIGDTIVALPSFLAIKKRYPKSKIVLITNSPPNLLIKGALDVLDGKIFESIYHYKKSFLSQLRLLMFLRLNKSQKLYYLPTTQSNERKIIRDLIFFKYIGGIKNIVGIENFKKIKLEDKNKNINSTIKESDRLWEIANQDNKLVYPKRPYIKFNPECLEKFSSLISKIENASIVYAIGHGTKFEEKNWGVNNFIKLISNLLRKNKNILILLFGGSEDIKQAELIKSQIKNKKLLILSGKTNIQESAALISLCTLYIGNDTGTMHIASAMKVPCLALFSNMSKKGKWEPFGNNNRIIRKDIICGSCKTGIKLKSFYCPECVALSMKAINFKEVIKVHDQMIKTLL